MAKGAASGVGLIVLCFLLPPLAVALVHGPCTQPWVISLLLTILFWLPGILYALAQVHGAEKEEDVEARLEPEARPPAVAPEL